jgi:Tfp pilus assembly protein PilN
MEIKLNLIPQYRKDEIAQSTRLRTILRWAIELFFIIIIFFVILLSLKYILIFSIDIQTSELESKQKKERYEKVINLDDNFKTANALVSFNESIQGDQLYWSRLFEKLSEIIPDGISVIKLASKNNMILIAGTADTRDILVDMREKLSQEQCFYNVNLPLSNLVSKDNVAFQIEFDIKNECIKNK